MGRANESFKFFSGIWPAIIVESNSVFFEEVEPFLPRPPYFSGALRRGFTFGPSAHRSFLDKRKFMAEPQERAREPYIPGLKRRGFTARPVN
jgi:hypothetical protein